MERDTLLKMVYTAAGAACAMLCDYAYYEFEEVAQQMFGEMFGDSAAAAIQIVTDEFGVTEPVKLQGVEVDGPEMASKINV